MKTFNALFKRTFKIEKFLVEVEDVLRLGRVYNGHFSMKAMFKVYLRQPETFTVNYV